MATITHPVPSIAEQIQSVEDCIRSMRQSYTHTFGEHQGKVLDPIAARDVARLEAALETLKRVAMGS
jgi:hypothetical protein